MKTATVIHGMPDNKEYYDVSRPASSNSHWLPWIQKQLLLLDVLAQTPEMPMPYEPEYQAWEKTFEQFPLNEDTILIGHSCGAGFIVRYLSEKDVKVGKVALVAPWLDPGKQLTTGMFDFVISPEIVTKTRGLTIFNSKDDGQEVHDSVAKIITATGGAASPIKLIEFSDRGHFTHEDMPEDAFPELLETVK